MNVQEKIFMFENQIALLEAALENAKSVTVIKSLEYRIKQTNMLLKTSYKSVYEEYFEPYNPKKA
jgi:hypothetical protein